MDSLRVIYHFLYDDSKLFLKRKKEKFDLFMNSNLRSWGEYLVKRKGLSLSKFLQIKIEEEMEKGK